MKKVAIQGQQASYHDQAAQKFFGKQISLVSCDTFRETFDAVTSGRADYAVVAIENSLYGSINDTYDLLLKSKFWVSGEVYLRIEHCLVGLPGASLADISEVHSQAPALSQCANWLDQHLAKAKRVEQHDTAASVAMVKTWQDPGKAAIASRAAAKLHQLSVLASNIEDHHQNYTRFIVVQKQKTTQKTNKTSLVLTTKSDTEPGALHRALAAFATRNINLSMLQSRPLVGKAWHYMFYIDVDTATTDDRFMAAVSDLKQLDCQVDILGSYSAASRQ